ncbi:hypothetical protein NDU88_002903 [Pleurodeles waltl]|uniref:Uncharacterized protein n=1 Tax=Pleurodeles waltl TaxID=8319 RepID=A0AAV7W4P3_PLEWA|nr:hypothetical protein NDU88_002903 [Pleurodeles waltl]
MRRSASGPQGEKESERRRSKKKRSKTEERETERTPRREPQTGGSGEPKRGLSSTGELRTTKQTKETGTTRRPGKQSATAHHASGEAWQTQASLGHSPFELLFSRQPRTLLEMLAEQWEETEEEVKNLLTYTSELRENLHMVWEEAHTTLRDAQSEQKQWCADAAEGGSEIQEPDGYSRSGSSFMILRSEIAFGIRVSHVAKAVMLGEVLNPLSNSKL